VCCHAWVCMSPAVLQFGEFMFINKNNNTFDLYSAFYNTQDILKIIIKELFNKNRAHTCTLKAVLKRRVLGLE